MLQTPHVTARRPSTNTLVLCAQIFETHLPMQLLGIVCHMSMGKPSTNICTTTCQCLTCLFQTCSFQKVSMPPKNNILIVPPETCYFQTWKQISPSKRTMTRPCTICKMWADYPLGDAAQMSTMQLQRQAPYRQQATLCKLTATHQSKNQQHHSVKSKVHGL